MDPVTADVLDQKARERDPHRLQQRQKQIDYGKQTIGYRRYRQAVPKNQRWPGAPQTPDIHLKLSKRNWDARLRAWRRQLHAWDNVVVVSSHHSLIAQHYRFPMFTIWTDVRVYSLLVIS